MDSPLQVQPGFGALSGSPIGIGRSEIANWLFPQEKATLKSTSPRTAGPGPEFPISKRFQ
jgi:hypothetical protein